MTSEERLRAEVQKGIELRFPEGMPESYKARLEYELGIIESMGFPDYLLVVKDFLEYGRLLGYVPKEKIKEAPITIAELKAYIKQNGYTNPGFRIGPGRGSAVGSLVCYLLGITNLDPIKYGLLFERFLNPERVSMPDIDSDISADTRQKVIEYVQNKYGKDAVCGIMTTNAQAPKGSIRIAAKFYGLKEYNEPMTSLGNTICKDVPKDVGTSFATTVDETGRVDQESETSLYDYLREKYKTDKDAIEVLRWAKVVEGSFTAYGSHAAGIVISDNKDVSDYIPLRWNSRTGMMTTQCDMAQTEENGLLKFDFLGLKTLDIITESMFMIEKNHGIIIDPLKIDVNDSRVYKEIFAAAKTNSVFQFESAGMKAMLKRFKPACFEDLIILVSMFRPGPLQYLDGVIDVKNGKKEMTFLTPELEAIVGKTYGAIVYQEQVMEICQQLAGFTLGHADEVRRYMSKKKKDKLAHEEEVFISGCEHKGISKEIATELFNQMMDFARYAFNKSHAAAYAYNAFITAWLKCYYPAEFMAAALNWADNDGISGLVYEAQSLGVKVYAPDINLSQKEFSAADGSIRFGLSSIAGVKNHADEILADRANGQYNSVKDFCIRINPNIQVIDHLISAGAFDAFSKNRVAMKVMVNEIKEVIPNIQKKTSFIKSANLVLPVCEKLSAQELIAMQEEAGLKAEIKEPTTAEKLQKRIDNASQTLSVLNSDLSLIKEKNIEENKTERMANEKNFLGMYVTEHPMDFYPNCSTLKVSPVSEISEFSEAAYGVVINLQIKSRKKDGAKMAFFELEDRSGKIDVCCFTKAYAEYADVIKEGAVLKLIGKVDVEEEEEETRLKFFVSEATIIAEEKKPVLLAIESLEQFKAISDTFRETYEEKEGRALILYDMKADKFVRYPVKVRDSILTLKNAKEYSLENAPK